MLGLLQFNRNIRSIRRSRQIVRILITYGFDHVLEMMNLSYIVSKGRRLLRKNDSLISKLSPAERVRLAAEALGPTFVKLGQLLSTRPDIIPQNYISELEKLQDNVPPVPYPEISAQIEKELKVSLSEIFEWIDPDSLAAASIAQVHAARLKDGTEVVIKSRRPGIAEIVETDIDLMMAFAHLAEKHIQGVVQFDPVGVVREFARTIRREMDLGREALTIDKFRANFSGSTLLYFPKVYSEATSTAVLTMEHIRGIKVNDLKSIKASGLDPKLLAKSGAESFLKMVIEHGFFHGDPHPGNIQILPDGRICLLDYGMVGRLDRQLREYLANLLMALVKRDIDELVSLLVYSGEIIEPVDSRKLRRELSEFVESYYEIPLKQVQIGKLLVEFIEIVTEFRIRLQPDMILLAKALVTIEGIGRELDPDFDMTSILKPYIASALKEKFSPSTMAKEVQDTAKSYLHLFRTLPRDIREFVSKLNRNSFKIDLEHRGLEHFTREIEKSINRLSFSLIISALIVGSSIVMQIDKGPKLLGFPLFAFTGYLIAAFIGFWWIIAILRSGRL